MSLTDKTLSLIDISGLDSQYSRSITYIYIIFEQTLNTLLYDYP